jgi:DNA ligase-1
MARLRRRRVAGGRDGAVAPFADLQKRLNRKQVSARMLQERPAFIRAYDLLHDGEVDLRALPFARRRRARLEGWAAGHGAASARRLRG